MSDSLKNFNDGRDCGEDKGFLEETGGKIRVFGFVSCLDRGEEGEGSTVSLRKRAIGRRRRR